MSFRKDKLLLLLEKILISLFINILLYNISYGFTPILLARWTLASSAQVSPIEVWYSDNGGGSWLPKGIVDSCCSGDMGIAIGVNNSGNLYLVAIANNDAWGGSLPFDGARFYFSSDTGNTWELRSTITDTSVFDINSAGMWVINDTTVFVYLFGNADGAWDAPDSTIEIYKTTDGGYNWNLVSSFIVPKASYGGGGSQDPEGEMYLGPGGFYISEWTNHNYYPYCYFSSDGINWACLSSISLDHSSMKSRSTAIMSIYDTLFATVWGETSPVLKCYRSCDSGHSWQYISTIANFPTSDDGSHSLGATADGSFYCILWDYTHNTLVFRSDDKGLNWSPVGTIPPHAHSWACALSLIPINIASPQGCKEADYNQFNLIKNINSFAIEYELLKDSFVEVKIYDLAGKLVSILFNGFEPKGKYKLEWKLTISGLYFFRIQINKDIKIGKILVLK